MNKEVSLLITEKIYSDIGMGTLHTIANFSAIEQDETRDNWFNTSNRKTFHHKSEEILICFHVLNIR